MKNKTSTNLRQNLSYSIPKLFSFMQPSSNQLT